MGVRSYHIPIVLQAEDQVTGPCPFRFEKMWLEILGFLEKLKGWWRGFVIEGSASFIFAQKLKLLKECIVWWKREGCRRFDSRKLVCLKKIEDLD